MDLYYQPEKSGYILIDEIEWRDESYEFDLTVLVKTVETNKYYVADDQGCSCPCPFEDTTFEDLTEITKLQDLIDYLAERSDGSPRVTAEVASMISKYRDSKNN